LKKAAQKLLFIWAMGAISPTPMAQINKSLFGGGLNGSMHVVFF
jgi:hypothetical protein